MKGRGTIRGARGKKAPERKAPPKKARSTETYGQRKERERDEANTRKASAAAKKRGAASQKAAASNVAAQKSRVKRTQQAGPANALIKKAQKAAKKKVPEAYTKADAMKAAGESARKGLDAPGSQDKRGYVGYKKGGASAKSFREAFAAARKAGKKTFTWAGSDGVKRSYSTNRKGE
jgi:hypothetical protein